MRLTPPNLIAIGALILAVLLSLASAYIAVNVVENRAEAAIRSALAREAITWVDVQGDGLQVRLSGTAQSEARRFRVVTITGTIIDANRVIDNIEVTPTKPLEAPQFSLELLRNDSGVSMIGLIPADGRRTDITNAARNAANGARITDMLNTADYPAGQNWNAALDFGLKALEILPRSKISVTNQRVVITAISDSRAQKHKLEAELLKAKPADIIANIDISAPRPVITPFTLRLVMDESGTRFDACSADTTEAADRILTAAKAAGATAQATCTVGLGVPTPAWGKAVESGIRALAELGGGSLTFSDADVTLVALDSTEQSLFDRVT
uniref:BON domain-containing protein n=1 Tax=Actibacterium sp. TaxID=1872125 RepID=UPI003569ECE7